MRRRSPMLAVVFLLLVAGLRAQQAADDGAARAKEASDAGFAFFKQSEYARALESFERAYALSRTIGDKRLEARVLFGIAQTLKNQGAYPRSLERGGLSVAAYESLGDNEGAARAWMVIGSVQDLMGRYRDALASYAQAQRLFGGAVHETSIRLLNEIGITYKNLGEYETALDYYTRALAAQVTKGDRYGQAVTLHNTAVLHSLLGEPERAIEFAQRSLAIARELGDRRGQSILLGNLAVMVFERGDLTRASDFLQQQLRLTRELGNRNEEALALKNLGDVDAARGEPLPARRQYGEALAIQREIGARTREAATMLAVVDLDLMQGAVAAAERGATEALAIATSAAAPELEWKSQLALARAARLDGRTDAAINRLSKAVAIVNDLRAGVHSDSGKIGFLDARQQVFHELASVLIAAGRPAEALEAAEAGRARAFADLLAFREVQGRPGEDGELRSLLSAETPSSGDMAGIASRLKATVVEYLVADRELLIWTVSPNREVHGTRVDVGRERLESLVTAVRSGMSTATVASSRPTSTATRELDRLLVQPIQRWLPASPDDLVVIVPHGPLTVLPFAALEDVSGTPFMVRHTVAAVPAISVYRYTPDKARAAQSKTALIVADPVPPPGSQLTRLPHAREEGRQVTRHLAPGAVTLLSGSQAMEAVVKSDASGRGILHFATHGIIAPDRPLASSIVLSAGNGEDGYLRADEVFSLSLSASLVVLSGCSTGLGRVSGDGIVGLSRAFMYAGTPRILVSQWDVGDRETAYLMDRFYAAYKSGRSAAAALRTAQLETRRRYAHPSQWAAFVLIGEP